MTVHADPRSDRPRRGFGIVGSLSSELVRALAAAAEGAGYDTFWSNDGPDGEGLASLCEAAAVTATIRLAVGVIPLDRVSPEQIVTRIAELELPEERLIVGVGSGESGGGLARVREGISDLRQRTGVSLVVAAMGPKMCALAGQIADGVLLDWATPAYAERVQGIVAEAAASVGRRKPWVADYVFTALGPAGGQALREQATYYADISAYTAHFARMKAGPLETVVRGEDPQALQDALVPFDAALDETVVRAVVAQETAEAYLAVLRAAAPTNARL